MKTVTFKITDNGNYVACILPIKGQQSFSDEVYIYNSDFLFLKIEQAHPMFTWVGRCESICTVAGCKFEPVEIQTILKNLVDSNVRGYSTANVLKSSNPCSLLAPLQIANEPTK